MRTFFSRKDAETRSSFFNQFSFSTLAPWRFIFLFALLNFSAANAATTEPPPDPGFEISVQAADVIVDADILAGGPFRAVAQTRKLIKGNAPALFELEGYNSYNWDTVHQGFQPGTRFILFLSKTDRPDVFAPLTPAAPRLAVQQDGVLLSLGDPPFRIPIKRADMEEALALMLESSANGKVPDRAEAFIRRLWDAGDIEPRYLAIALAGALRDEKTGGLLVEASKDKLLKMRLTAIEALGKVASAQTIAALRSLLKDEKATVSREAARALLATRDVDSVPSLLEWIRKLSETPPLKGGNKDSNAIKAENVSEEILVFALNVGQLLDVDAVWRPLLEIAKGRNTTLGKDALVVLGTIADAPQIPSLLELAEDRTSVLKDSAMVILQRATLSPASTLEEFRSWWEKNSKDFGEDQKRARVESAAKILLRGEDSLERRAATDVIRAAPAGIALISAAPVLLKESTSNYINTDDLAVWNSPLTLPFLVERLGRITQSERRDALAALVQLCGSNPRLRDTFWPLIRAQLSDDAATTRRVAQTACARLGQAESLSALLDTLQYAGNYESQDASKSFYSMTARTLGFSFNEPIADAIAARKRLRGWWEGVEKPYKPLFVVSGTTLKLPRIADETSNKLETQILSQDSLRSSAAFALAFATKPDSDPLWKKLQSQSRQRDRAHGLLGLVGGDAAAAPDLSKRLFSSGDEAEPPLCRAIALLDLATLRSNGKPIGAEKIVEWLKSPGAKFELPWRRMAIVSLGLADGEPQSLSLLETLIKQGMAAKAPDRNDTNTEPPSEERQLFTAAFIALRARNDSNALLVKILESEQVTAENREAAARTLSLRRYEPAAESVFKALEIAGRYEWQDLCRALDPLLKPTHAAAINALLDSTNAPARSAAAYILNSRPEIGNDAETRGHLLGGLNDTSSIVKYYCAEALGKRKAVSAIKKLIDLFKDDDDEVKSAAAEALGNIGDKESCEIAAAAFEFQTRVDIRWLKALAIAGKPDHIALLIKLCNSTSYVDQRAGIEALGASRENLGYDTLLKIFRNDESAFQTNAGDALAQMGEIAIEKLDEDLKSPDKNRRTRVLHLLSRIPSPASRTILTQASKDEDPAIRTVAEFSLSRLNAVPKDQPLDAPKAPAKK